MRIAIGQAFSCVHCGCENEVHYRGDRILFVRGSEQQVAIYDWHCKRCGLDNLGFHQVGNLTPKLRAVLTS